MRDSKKMLRRKNVHLKKTYTTIFNLFLIENTRFFKHQKFYWKIENSNLQKKTHDMKKSLQEKFVLLKRPTKSPLNIFDKTYRSSCKHEKDH